MLQQHFIVYHEQGNVAEATEMYTKASEMCTKAYRILLKVLGLVCHPKTLDLKPLVYVTSEYC